MICGPMIFIAVSKFFFSFFLLFFYRNCGILYNLQNDVKVITSSKKNIRNKLK